MIGYDQGSIRARTRTRARKGQGQGQGQGNESLQGIRTVIAPAVATDR